MANKTKFIICDIIIKNVYIDMKYTLTIDNRDEVFNNSLLLRYVGYENSDVEIYSIMHIYQFKGYRNIFLTAVYDNYNLSWKLVLCYGLYENNVIRFNKEFKRVEYVIPPIETQLLFKKTITIDHIAGRMLTHFLKSL